MKFLFRYGLLAAFLCCNLPLIVQAQTDNPALAKELIIKEDKIYDPEKLSLDSLQDYEKKFTFDWNNYTSISSNQNRIQEIENFYQDTPSDELQKLDRADKEAFGHLLYKLGTYYAHIQHQPNEAIKYLSSVNNFLTMPSDKAWTYNQLSYAYQLKFEASNEEADQKESLFFINKINSIYADKQNKEVAFAYCVKGLLENTAGDAKQAELDYKAALAMYEKIPDGKNEQYQRARNRLAAIMLSNDKNDQALDILLDLKKYWQQKGKITENPYAARNLFVLGETYLKLGKPLLAQKDINEAVRIYETVYGKDNEMLMYPYQLLADTYKALGKKSLADAYQIQANNLDKS